MTTESTQHPDERDASRTTQPAARPRLGDLAGKAAIVTGAASGIGLALAHALAACGVDLALADINARALEAARAQLAPTGRRVVTRVLDVSSDADVRAAAAEFESQLGKIHLLFNNAGIDMSGKLESLSEQDWTRVFGVNVFGVIHGIRHFVPLLRRHGEPAHVVNTASGAGFWVNRDVGMGAYAATKSCVIALSEALEHDLDGSAVGVSVLCPGPVATPIAERSAQASKLLRASIAAGMPAHQVATRVLDAMRDGEFYIFTHAQLRTNLERRFARIVEALARVPQ
jgi:NAD(P)-dependent dehydrogenase (short-subunit alcohol dehydrogenase family)